MDSLLRCPFCGGEANLYVVNYWGKSYIGECSKCGVETKPMDSEAKAIQAWNRRVATDKNVGDKERTAKVVEYDASVTDTDGYKYHRSEYLCGACKKKVLGGDDYCSHCGAKLDWSEDE